MQNQCNGCQSQGVSVVHATINTIESSNIEVILEINSSNRVGHKGASHIHARLQNHTVYRFGTASTCD